MSYQERCAVEAHKTTRVLAALAAAALAAVVAAALAVASAGTADAAEKASQKFGDVEAGSWYEPYVQWALDEDMVTGYGPDYAVFGVGDEMCRADFVTVLWRHFDPAGYAAYDQASAVNTTGLPDVADGSYYTGAADWAVRTGVVTGYDGQRFGPGDPVTREQAVVVLYRLLAARGDDVSATDAALSSFPDAGSVSAWAYDAMAWATTHGLVTGVQHDDGCRVDPCDAALREQVCKVAEHACDHDTASVWRTSEEQVWVEDWQHGYICRCGAGFATDEALEAHQKPYIMSDDVDLINAHFSCHTGWYDAGWYETQTVRTCRICGAAA